SKNHIFESNNPCNPKIASHQKVHDEKIFSKKPFYRNFDASLVIPDWRGKKIKSLKGENYFF
ncbi:MAG TPA: hypothetical protein PLC80_00015, partial [Draconibacterium sp.]|nr:hypothetical protein [Draconibacterium sp.]